MCLHLLSTFPHLLSISYLLLTFPHLHLTFPHLLAMFPHLLATFPHLLSMCFRVCFMFQLPAVSICMGAPSVIPNNMIIFYVI
ncbi:uncharacterized protein BJ212DRAFT_1348209 [Suillus subaureus]|uniref:Uncharacterized protein n=1 Tax=Suillus subaureus TaxID=48587 RepID=A0A9P7JEK3_9AGAM|nr:uncharacterized protein BJ212DRAFT_1348209 [Suillus subaureus]KAG1818005.1 hypothetical protein BJ212DRAFT_1348209 [Suillus subaureus]